MLSKNKRISTIIRLAKQAFAGYKLEIITLTALGFLGGIFEGIGVNAIIPMLSFIIGEEGGGVDFISRTIRKFFDFIHLDFSLKYLLIFICSLFVLKAGVTFLCSFISIRITSDYEQKTKNDLFQRVLRANWPFLLERKMGYVSTIISSEVGAGVRLLGAIGQSIIIATSLLIYLLVAFNISSQITLITLGLGGVLFLVFKPLMYRTRLLAKETVGLNKETAHFIEENVVGMKTVKSMAVEEPVGQKAQAYFERSRNLRIKTMLFGDVSGALIQPISLIFICLVFAVSYLSTDFRFPTFLAIIYLIEKIFTYVQSGQNSLRHINQCAPFLKSAMDFRQISGEQKEKSKGIAQFSFKKELRLEDVHFAYAPGRSVLSGVSFNLDKGEMVGIIGPSGSGKTTLVDVLLQLLQPQKGRVLLDGKDVAEIKLKDWRDNIGYVSQDIFLANDTIAGNIKFYDQEISDEKIRQAAKMANIYDFIEGLPEKFSTVVGERGVMLSVGQRQRIILARVLARNPQILILDEATSALDNESEILVQKAIGQLKGKLTVLIIAHRLSTVLSSDRLLVLNKGKIIEQGQPQDLLKDKASYFYKVYNIRE